MKFERRSLMVAAVCLLAACGGGPKLVPTGNSVFPTQPAPVLTAPTASLRVEPEVIEAGQLALLRWTSDNGDIAHLEPQPGEVSLNGEFEVRPMIDTTYRLRVTGPGGEAEAAATVKVLPKSTQARTPAPKREGSWITFVETVSEIDDIYFAYDSMSLDARATAVLDQNSEVLADLFRDFPDGRVLIEGHCDERGSTEYNLALGDRRARAVREYLVSKGLPETRLKVASLGKERPQCQQARESCWQQNRRAAFAPLR